MPTYSQKDVEKVRAIVVPTYVLVEAKIRDKSRLNEKCILSISSQTFGCFDLLNLFIVRHGLDLSVQVRLLRFLE